MAKSTVTVGSARIDENGQARGGKAGNQNGKELGKQNWYKHKLGWDVLRAMDPNEAEQIAAAMEAAIANRHIGYDQGQRNTLYSAAAYMGFNLARVSQDVECDCSSLVRVCCAAAGIKVGDFRTTTEKRVLQATGHFWEMTGAEYTDAPDRLQRGDILVTRKQGHTVVVLTDGLLANKRDGAAQGSATVSPANPVEAALWQIIVGNYWLRKKPGMTGAKIAAVPAGSHVRVYGYAGDWMAVKVRETGQKGYMHGNALK